MYLTANESSTLKACTPHRCRLHEHGKEKDLYKGTGKSAINALLKENFAKVVPKDKEPVSDREAATNLLNQLGKHGFILRVNRGDPIGGKGTPRVLQPNPMQEMREDGYYMWIWEGSQLKLYIGALLLVLTVFAAVLFPLWPVTLRLGVWYLSVGVLGLLGVFFAIAIIRLIFYIITIIILPRGIWIFPNLFEDVGVVESFIPFWAWDEPTSGKNKKKAVSSSPSSQAAATAGVGEKSSAAASEE